MSLPERYRQLREEGKLPKQAWEQLKREYTAQFSSGDAAQSWKSASGKAFEDIVWQEFTSQCQGLKDLQVARWHEIPASLKEPLSERLWVRGEIQAVTAESNVDFVAYETDASNIPRRIIAVYSCKVSLRERFQQDLFWAERLRGRGIRFCFITLDNDGVLTRAAGTGDLIPIAQPKFTKTSMPDNPLLQVPPASRGNRTPARFPSRSGGNLRRGAIVNSGGAVGIRSAGGGLLPRLFS